LGLQFSGAAAPSAHRLALRLATPVVRVVRLDPAAPVARACECEAWVCL